MGIEILGPWGNEQPPSWSFCFSESIILKGFKIRHGEVVDGITFVLGDKSSNEVSAEQTFGGDGGKRDEVGFNIGEYITKIQGKSADYSENNYKRCITSITIFTNLSKEGYGPYGLGAKDGEHGATNVMPFSSPPLRSGAIHGFLGGASQYLESIGIFVNMVGQPTSQV